MAQKNYFFYSKVAEKCKENNWNFIDSGIAFQQLHIQAIYPGHSELFDTIIDYEDTSDEAPECVIKQFPTHIGKKIKKNSRPKKLVKSNKSISQNIFLTKFHF